MSQHGPRDVASVLDDRYWLTPKAYAALARLEHQHDQQQDQEDR